MTDNHVCHDSLNVDSLFAEQEGDKLFCPWGHPEGSVQCGSCDYQAGVLLSRQNLPPHGPPPTRTGTSSSPRLESATEPNARFRSLDWWREPVGTAGTKMASTSSTRTAGSTWTATCTGSLRRPLPLNGSFRTNLVRRTNRRLLGCGAKARLPNQCRSSFLNQSSSARLRSQGSATQPGFGET